MSTHTRIGSGAILCLAILLQSMTAMAAEDKAPSSAPSGPRASGDWSISAGVGFAGPSYGYEPYSQSGPTWGLTLERRLGRHTWMLLGVTGQYFAAARGSSQEGYFVEKTWEFEGHAGVRYVFNPGKAFEFSSYVMAGASHWRGYYGTYSRSFSTGVHGTLGISVDRELTDGVGVRISSNLASSGWAQVTNEILDSPGEQHVTAAFYGNIGFQPTVELRMTF
jgi:hypothetical protein